MTFLIIPELLEMENKLCRYTKSAKCCFIKATYERVLLDIRSIINAQCNDQARKAWDFTQIEKEKNMQEKDYAQEPEVGTESMSEEEKEKIADEAELVEIAEGEEFDTVANDALTDSDPVTA